VDRNVFQDHDFSASTALQDGRETSHVETTSSNPSSPSTRAGCSSHRRISVDSISPFPKAFSTVKNSRKSQSTQRAALLTSGPYKAQLELQEGKKKKLNLNVAALKKKVNHIKEDSWFCDMCQQESVQDMIKCIACKKWVHENCAGVKKGTKRYFCFSCV
jgi:hypothetical protein